MKRSLTGLPGVRAAEEVSSLSVSGLQHDPETFGDTDEAQTVSNSSTSPRLLETLHGAPLFSLGRSALLLDGTLSLTDINAAALVPAPPVRVASPHAVPAAALLLESAATSALLPPPRCPPLFSLEGGAGEGQRGATGQSTSLRELRASPLLLSAGSSLNPLSTTRTGLEAAGADEEPLPCGLAAAATWTRSPVSTSTSLSAPLSQAPHFAPFVPCAATPPALQLESSTRANQRRPPKPLRTRVVSASASGSLQDSGDATATALESALRTAKTPVGSISSPSAASAAAAAACKPSLAERLAANSVGALEGSRRSLDASMATFIDHDRDSRGADSAVLELSTSGCGVDADTWRRHSSATNTIEHHRSFSLVHFSLTPTGATRAATTPTEGWRVRPATAGAAAAMGSSANASCCTTEYAAAVRSAAKYGTSLRQLLAARPREDSLNDLDESLGDS